jgi:uncharacterized protein YraI
MKRCITQQQHLCRLLLSMFIGSLVESTLVAATSLQSCHASAYVIDQDPQGVNVRSGPSSNDKVIGNLPTTTDAVIVKLVAVQGNWVEISKADDPRKVVFQGSGWVYTQRLGTSTRGYGSAKGVNVYAGAANKSRVLGRIPSDKNVQLLGCSGSWVKVKYQGLTGWLKREDQCPNPLSTCP